MKHILNTVVPATEVPVFYNTAVKPVVHKFVNINVKFGDPRKNCAGSGICQLLAYGKQPCPNCKGTIVKGQLHRFDRKQLLIIIEKKDLAPSQLLKYFSKNIIPFKADIQLSSLLVDSLNMKGSLVICSGDYKLTLIGGYYHFFVEYKKRILSF